MWWILVLVMNPLVFGYEAVKLDWWETAVFYQIYTRSFMDSDGDGVGDINGITSRLEYLKELGVDAAWLTPIYKSPLNDFGYDVSDFYSIQPEYGTMEDFDQLLKKADELGIKILLELVPNHTSNESEWFQKSVSRDEYYNDWYIWESGYMDPSGLRQPPNNWISLFRKSAWTYHPQRDQFYLHQFGSSQPDLNYRNPVVGEEIKTILKYWLEKGVAGMRVDSINHIFEVDKEGYGGRYPDEPMTGTPGVGPDDYEFLDHVYTKDLEESYEIMSQFREVFNSMSVRDNFTRVMMVEADTNLRNAVKYYGWGTHIGAHIPFNHALVELEKDIDARDVKIAVDRWITYKPIRRAATWMTGDHDRARVASRFGPELVDAFNMLVLLLPGIALTYMGEEIGMENGFVAWTDTKDPLACNTDDPVNFIDVSRDPVRTPFQWNRGKNAGFSSASRSWLPAADGYENLNVANQRSALRSHYQLYRTLTALRRRPAFRIGRFDSLAFNSDIYAFKRWFRDDTYIVVINFGKSYHAVNLTYFDLVFGQLEVEASSVSSSRTYSDNVAADFLDLGADEALVLRMQS